MARGCTRARLLGGAVFLSALMRVSGDEATPSPWHVEMMPLQTPTLSTQGPAPWFSPLPPCVLLLKINQPKMILAPKRHALGRRRLSLRLLSYSPEQRVPVPSPPGDCSVRLRVRVTR